MRDERHQDPRSSMGSADEAFGEPGSEPASGIGEEAGSLAGLAALGALEPVRADTLASQLVWRIGRLSDDEPVTVRVGFATSAQLFAELPKLKNASDHEVEEAIRENALRVEWVGQRPA